jgi:F-type H+-transporting ATPase subunit a
MVHAPSLFDALHFPVEVQTLVFASILVLLLALAVRSGLHNAADEGIIPDDRITLRNLIEVLLEGITSLARDVIGEKWATYMPLVGTLGFFILISNLVGLLPAVGGPTSYIETNLAWAVIAVVVSEAVGFREHGFIGYLGHFAPGPWWIKPLTFPIEIISHLVRLLSLTVRLTANMFADHTLLGLFLSLGIAAWFIPWIVMGLGLFVAFIQAFIFTFLTMIYIGLALEHAH